MNNPIDTQQFKHYLIFHSFGNTTPYQICEPIGFDASSFTKKQESKRWARSVEYGALSKLTFIDAYGSTIDTPQVINEFGDVSNRLEYGLQWLLSGYRQFGFEFEVEYLLEKSGVQFSLGVLDFTDKEVTDGYTYVTCKLIQKGKVANLKRRLDDKFNVFSDNNVNQETITPAPSLDFLLKAVPIEGNSEWSLPNATNITFFPIDSVLGERYLFNFLNQVDKFEVNNTLSFIQDSGFVLNDSQAEAVAKDFIYLRAQNTISDGVLTFENINISFTPTNVGNFNVKAYYSITENGEFDYSNKVLIYSENNPTSLSINQTINTAFERGNSIHFWFELTILSSTDPAPNVVANWSSGVIKFKATSTAIDTVVKGVRWIDVIKQASKFTDALPIDAPLFDVGGEHYNNVCFNRRMISQNITNFTLETKKAFESVFELNCDYEPTEEGIFIGHQKDYYTNTEIGSLTVIPSEDFFIEENDRCQINKFNYGFKSFEQDRQATDTSQGIHTDSQFTLLNKNVENNKEVKNEFIRDPLLIQSIVNLEVAKPLTATEDDDKVMILDIVPLAPSSFAEWSARLLMRIVDGKLEILNRDSEGENNDTIINWLVLGFGVGATFQITSGQNIGNYTVTTITQSVLTLTPVAFTPTFEGDALITVKYFYTSVLWTNRTNEGFAQIENLNTSRFGNLRYTIKRNLLRFGEYLASCLLYSRKDIPNAYFKSNGDCATRLTTETELVVEDGTIEYDSLPNPLTTAKILKLTCVAEFNEVLSILEAYKLSRGFIRAYDSYGRVIKGYIQQLDHTWATNELKLTLEERFETEFLMLTYADGVLTVNDVVYELGGNSNWWIAENDYFKFFDKNSIPLCNFYRYNFVSLQGVVYETKDELLTALLAL